MKLHVQSIHFDADQKLLDFVQQKTGKLERFYNKIIDGQIFLKLDKDSTHTNKIAEIKINIPGSTLVAKEKCKSFEEATDLAVESLRIQIRKYKGKHFDRKSVSPDIAIF